MTRARLLLAVPVAAVLAVAAACTIGAGRASAHAALIDATPAAGAVVTDSPTEIVLRFSEPVDVVPDAIRLLDDAGVEIPLGEVTQILGAETLAASVPRLTDGTYVVGWSILSADSHPITAAYTFSVGVATDTAPGLLDAAIDGRSGSGTASGGLAVGRWMSFAGLALVLGTAVVLMMCAPALLGRRRTTIVLTAGTVIGVVGTAAMIVAQTRAVTGSAWSPSGWRTVLDSTSGRWWWARLIALPITGATFAVQPPWNRWISRLPVVVLGGLLLVVYASGGHAVSGRSQTLGFVSTIVHLGAMSVWIGGVATLLLIARRDETWPVAVRFSIPAAGSVGALAVTGIFQAWRQLGGITNLADTVYGRWLIVKVALVAVLVALATLTRRNLRVSSHDDSTGEADTQHGAIAVALRRIVAVEAGLIALVLAATAGLVNATPPLTQSRAPASVTVTSEGFLAQVIVDPAVTGGTVLHVYINSVDGTLLRPDEVTVQAALPAQQLGPFTIPTFRAGPDHVTTPDADFPIAGRWTLTITMRYQEFEQVTFTAAVSIS